MGAVSLVCVDIVDFVRRSHKRCLTALRCRWMGDTISTGSVHGFRSYEVIPLIILLMMIDYLLWDTHKCKQSKSRRTPNQA